MLLPLTVYSARQGDIRFALFYAALLITLFLICFLNPFSTGDSKNSKAGDDQRSAQAILDRPVMHSREPELKTSAEDATTGSTCFRDPPDAQEHRLDEETPVIDFSKLRSGSDMPSGEESETVEAARPSAQRENQAKEGAPAVFSASVLTTDADHPAARHAPQQQTHPSHGRIRKNPPPAQAIRSGPATTMLVQECESVDSILMGSLDRRIEITRQEVGGYLVQTTVITEKKVLEQSETTRTLKALGLSANILDDDEEPSDIRNMRISGEQNKEERSDSAREKEFHPLAYTFRILKFIFMLTIVCALIIAAVWIAGSMYAKDKTRSGFDDIVRSIEPVRKQVEICIASEGPRYVNVCSNKRRSESAGWDLSDRYISNHKDPNIASIRVDGGTITVYANYDHEFRGATYISVPTRLESGKIRWDMSPESTCLAQEICSGQKP